MSVSVKTVPISKMTYEQAMERAEHWFSVALRGEEAGEEFKLEKGLEQACKYELRAIEAKEAEQAAAA